jgi:hypothetical protein
MKKIFGLSKLSALVVAVIALAHIGMAQCPSPIMVFRPEPKSGWGLSSQSKSGALMTGETYEFTFIAQRGMEYRISSVGGSNELTKDKVQFRVSDTQVNRVIQDGQEVFKRSNVVIFDSKSTSGDEECVIVTPKTRKLTVTVNVVGTENPKDIQCAVVFVESRRAQTIGLK